MFPLVTLNHEFASKSVLAAGIKKIKFTKYQLESDLGYLLTSSRIQKPTIFVLCQQHSVWMSSTADRTSKNTSEISHCKRSIGFSLSWESMHFRHLASEYDLFDPLKHVWEGVKKKKKCRTADWLSRKQSRCYSSKRDRREGRARSTGRRAQEEKKGRYFYFDSITQAYVLLFPVFGYLSVLCVATSKGTV